MMINIKSEDNQTNVEIPLPFNNSKDLSLSDPNDGFKGFCNIVKVETTYRDKLISAFVNQLNVKLEDFCTIKDEGHVIQDDTDIVLLKQTNNTSNSSSKGPIECDLCKCQFVSEKFLEKHVCRFTGDKSFQCGTCDRKFLRKDSLKRHVCHIHIGEDFFICDICDDRFKEKKDLKMHILAHSGEKPCNSKFSDKISLKKPIGINTQKHQLQTQLLAYTDDNPFTNEFPSVKSSSQEQSLTDDTGKCDICNKTFKRKYYLKKHYMFVHSNEKPFACKECNSKFSLEESLKRHILTHNSEKPFVCNICKDGFKWKSQLKIHLCSHTGEEPFVCSTCNCVFVDKRSLRKHVSIHSDERPFQCTKCNYKCRQNSQLKRHFLNHDIKGQCNICDYKSPYKRLLQRHMRQHGNEDFYTSTCGVCNHKFRSRSDLQRHISVHSGEKPFLCNICSYRCTRKTSLTQHIRIHTGEKPFACNICDYKCRQKSGLTQHMSKYH